MSKKNRSKEIETGTEKRVEKREDKSLYVFQREKLKVPLSIRNRYKNTEKLNVIYETIADKSSKVIMIDGYWGTGKTSVAVLSSLDLLNKKSVDGIIYLRNPLEATSTTKLGALPGTISDKMAPYNAIIEEKLSEFLSKPDIDFLHKDGRIECYPIGLIQGKTFSCKAVIIDEAASLSYDDLMLTISRIGEYCKVFIIGDSTFQLTIGNKSGFRRFFETFMDEESMLNGIFTFELKEKADILRSGLLRFIMEKTGIIKGLYNK